MSTTRGAGGRERGDNRNRNGKGKAIPAGIASGLWRFARATRNGATLVWLTQADRRVASHKPRARLPWLTLLALFRGYHLRKLPAVYKFGRDYLHREKARDRPL